MYPPPGRLPLRLAVKINLDTWLDTLEISLPSSTTDQESKVCSSCKSVQPVGDPCKGAGNNILLLPCGCPWHRRCLERTFGIKQDNGDKCTNCNLQIFQEWEVISWIDTLERVPLSAISTGEVYPECAICKTHYRRIPASASEGTPERPVILPCKHILGEACLLNWLTPDRGASNFCPICRNKLFSPRPYTRILPRVADDEAAEARRLQERQYWDRFMLGHQQLHRLSATDAVADREFMNAQLNGMETDYRELVFEPRWMLNDRRENVRGLLLSRMVERARARREILRLERYGES